MEIEKTLVVAALREQVWALLLDPEVMAGAVPGMKSIEVISPTEYVAVMHQKISFISAKFKLRTNIVEQRAPEYLCAEGTGEDKSVASSLKQRSEVFLTPTADGGTELRIKVSVDLLGRLGTFGLSVMKTKADRLWEEFGANLKTRIEAGGAVASVLSETVDISAAPPAESPENAIPGRSVHKPSVPACAAHPAVASSVATHGGAGVDSGTAIRPTPAQVRVVESADGPQGWLSRLLGRGSDRPSHASAGRGTIRVEVRELNRTISVEWPVTAADQCRAWLRELMA